jgi:beta-lactamase class A
LKILVLMAACAALSAQPSALEKEFARLAALSPGTLGATVIHLESGQQASYQGGERFPMASTYKIAIAYELLRRVDAGEEKLERMVTLTPADYHPGSGTLTALFNPPGFDQPGVALSLRHLLELMILISDNSATDILLREVGGPEAVNQQLAALGVAGVQVDGPTMEMIRNWRSNGTGGNGQLRNTATPIGMAALLGKVHRGEGLKPASAALFLDVLRRCQTGNARLKGMLPEGTAVWHKTGTLGGVANDAGFIRLPGEAGTLVIAVFVKGADAAASEKRDRAIAEIARAAHDYFLFRQEPVK